MRKKVLIFLLIGILLFVFTGCGEQAVDEGSKYPDGGKSLVEMAQSYRKSGKNPVATMLVKDFGMIRIELYPLKAPNTVYNFIYLANKGFYDGLTFHRVSKNFVIQGGDPKGDGTGDPGYSIKGEFGVNGFNYNNIRHERGVVSMARSFGAYDSAGCQFFIVLQPAYHLDLEYAAFGKVIEGMDVVDKIAAVEVEGEKPQVEIIIEKVTVDTFGDSYPEPEKITK